MDTSDRGLLDVERFDLEPDRPLFHGLLGDVQASDLVGLSTHDKIPYVLRILEPAQLSSRMAASMAEIDETLTTWPQLGGDVSLGAATIAAAIRRLGRGEHLAFGPGPGRSRRRPSTPWPNPTRSTPATSPRRCPSPARPIPTWPWPTPPTSPRPVATRSRGRCGSTPDGSASFSIGPGPRPWTWRFRGSYVAIGAALLNARIAAAAHGLLGSVE